MMIVVVFEFDVYEGGGDMVLLFSNIEFEWF